MKENMNKKLEGNKINTENITTETKKIVNGTEKELEKELKDDDIEIKLSEPNETTQKVRSYTIENSYFANKGTCRSERTKTYTIQDLVTITVNGYCSPDGRSYSYNINNIDLFPTTESQPTEYDNTTSDKYGSGQYDYLSYDKGNKNIFQYEEYNNLGKSIIHYFRISPDNNTIIPEIENVTPCNGGFFHHIQIDENNGDYKDPGKKTIQETIKELYKQKKEKEQITEYRKKNGDIGLTLPRTIYSSGYYEPKVYMGDKHGVLAHEHSNEKRNTNTICVKYGKPGDYLNFVYLGQWYSVSIWENNSISITGHTMSSRCNNQKWWQVECLETKLQKGQILINGYDVYDETIQTLSEQKKEKITKRESKFKELHETLINTYGFTQEEFDSLCKYAGKGKKIAFLITIKDMLNSESSKISKEEILNTIKEIQINEGMIFWNYILLKKKSTKISANIVSKIIEKGYARQYIYDHIPGISFVGYFDDVIGALKIGLDNGIFKGNKDIVYSTGNGEFKSDLAQKLIDAGLANK